MQTDNSPRFLHYRSFNEDGSVNSRSGATIAYVSNVDGTVTWAGAFCHPKDNYNKRMGRVKASGHLKSPKYATTTEVAMTDADFRSYIDENIKNVDGYVRKYNKTSKVVDAEAA